MLKIFTRITPSKVQRIGKRIGKPSAGLFDKLNIDIQVVIQDWRNRVELMGVCERQAYLTMGAHGFRLIGRLQRFAEDSDYLGRIAQAELDRIPDELKAAHRLFSRDYLGSDGLLDFDLPRERFLNQLIQESQAAGTLWERRLLDSVKASDPESLIRLEHRDYWRHNDIGCRGRVYHHFLTEVALDEFLKNWHLAEWTNYCNGHGDPSLSYLEIRIKRPGGDWESYEA